MPQRANTTDNRTELTDVLGRLGRRLAEIGLSLSVYDRAHESTMAGPSICEACHRLCATGGSGLASRSDLAELVWVSNQPQVGRTPAGCVLLGVPIVQRRRLTAVAMACYAPPDIGETEGFARECDRMELDRQYMAEALKHCTAHSPDEAHDLLKILRWMIDQELDNAVARQELTTLSTNLGHTYEELALLYRLSGQTKINNEPDEFFQGVCSELVENMRIRSAVAVVNSRTEPNSLGMVIRAGATDLSDAQLRQLIERQVLPQLRGGNRSVVVNECARRGQRGAWPETLMAAPLSVGGQPKGYLLALDRIEGDFDSVDLKLLNSVGDQAAVYLANNHLYDELQELLMGVLHVLTASIDAKDRYTCGHSQRVALLSRRLATLCGFDAARVRTIYLTGLLHDIGKIGVPETILYKPGKLTTQEFDTIKRHPVIGANILSNICQMRDVIPGVLHHHERMDGRGYPDGLVGQNVPIEGRIVGLADSFDAMSSSRTYRTALPMAAVKAEIMRFSGTQFDPVLVDYLLTSDLDKLLDSIHEEEPTAAAIDAAIFAEAGHGGPGPRRRVTDHVMVKATQGESQ